jgi:hypothetical protein
MKQKDIISSSGSVILTCFNFLHLTVAVLFLCKTVSEMPFMFTVRNSLTLCFVYGFCNMNRNSAVVK